MKNRKREICTSGSMRDEAGQPPHLSYDGSTFSAFNGTDGKRMVTSITTDELKLSNPATSTGVKADSVWRRAK
jgi:hypothetical protein